MNYFNAVCTNCGVEYRIKEKSADRAWNNGTFIFCPNCSLALQFKNRTYEVKRFKFKFLDVNEIFIEDFS